MTRITIERETLERAIDALQWHYDRGYPDQPTDEPRKRDARTIRTLRAALAQKAEPPSCKYCDGTGDVHSLGGQWRGRCTECNFSEPQTQKDKEQYAFEDWLASECPSGNVESVQSQWEASAEYLELQPGATEQALQKIADFGQDQERPAPSQAKSLALLDLDSVEHMQGGANGPTIRLRGFINAQTGPTAPQPPIDNAFVADGCEQFSPPAEPAPVPCCGKYETCSHACTPRGKWLGRREAERAALAAQPAPAAVPLTRPHCRECAKWAKAQADNKEWMDGVVRGREIVARLAAAENRMTDDLPPLSGLRPCLHQSPVP